jgi:hypothetical protein
VAAGERTYVGNAVDGDVVLCRPVVVDRPDRVDRPGVGFEAAIVLPRIHMLAGPVLHAGDEHQFAVPGGLRPPGVGGAFGVDEHPVRERFVKPDAEGIGSRRIHPRIVKTGAVVEGVMGREDHGPGRDYPVLRPDHAGVLLVLHLDGPGLFIDPAPVARDQGSEEQEVLQRMELRLVGKPDRSIGFPRQRDLLRKRCREAEAPRRIRLGRDGFAGILRLRIGVGRFPDKVARDVVFLDRRRDVSIAACSRRRTAAPDRSRTGR